MNAEELRNTADDYNKGVTYIQDVIKMCVAAAKNGRYNCTHVLLMAHYNSLLKYCNERGIVVTIISGKHGDKQRTCNISWKTNRLER